MTRVASRRRWVMTGPWPHPKTGILYYRKATPPDLFTERARLAEFGIKVTREVQRSLGTKDRKPAERTYKQIAEEIEAEWDRWRKVLRNGPQSLNEMEALQVAAHGAARRWGRYKSSPLDAPIRPGMDVQRPRLVLSDDTKRSLAGMTAEEREASRIEGARNVRRLQDGSRLEQLKELRNVRDGLGYPWCFPEFRSIGMTMAESLRGKETDEDLQEASIEAVDRWSRFLVNLEGISADQQLRESLERRALGDLREPQWVGSAATAEVKSARHPMKPDTGRLSLEYLLDHKAESQTIKAKTIADTRTHLKKFIAFVGHDDARRVTKDNVREWRDSLLAAGDLSPKTVSDRYLSALRSVLSHGVREFDLPLNPASDIRVKKASGAPVTSKGYTEGQALTILNATFRGSSKGLSAPHRRAIFWIPWILAYTGLRVTEAAQLQGGDLKEEDGIPFLLITPEAGSTKSGRAWMTGVHQHLKDLGMIRLFKDHGPGPIFYEPYPNEVDLQSIAGKSRAAEAGKRVGNWITEELGITAPLNRPSHAWRHLFTTRSRDAGMDKEARDFMMGSRSQTDAREGYGDWPPRVLDVEINKIPRFVVSKSRRHSPENDAV